MFNLFGFNNINHETLVDCSKVYVKKSCIESAGVGVYSKKFIKKNSLIEKGLVRRIDFDGNKSPYLFTWSEDKTIWAFGSGCSTFYNTGKDPNTKMVRFFDEDRFEIYALRDIQANEELTHLYKSLEWRECFQSLKIEL